MTLSDGTKIPAGTLFYVPNYAYSLDPEAWESPTTFKGFRHVESAQPNETNDPQQQQHFGVPHLRELTFGIGRHACPGRFYAVAEIKMVLALLIRDYDMRLDDGVTEAPEATTEGWLVFVDEDSKLLFRKVA